MSTLPVENAKCIEFVRTRAETWRTNAVAIGITPAIGEAVTDAADAAQTAFDAQQSALAAAKAATVNLRTAMKTLRTEAGGAIRLMRAKAVSSNNPDIYALALISPPANPTPALPPTQPTDLRVVVETTGALTIEFKPTTPAPAGQDASTSGVVYFIKRKLSGESAFTIIGATPATRTGTRGMTSYTDSTLPGGGLANNVQYVIQGQRAVTRGPALLGPASPIYTVMLGSGTGPGTMVVRVVESGDGSKIKMAA